MPSSCQTQWSSAGRPSHSALGDITFGAFCLHPDARLLERNGAPVPVGSRALDLLCALAARPGEVVRKDELLTSAWPDLTVDESNLRFHIAQLRRALGEGQAGERFIANVPGRGYCFVAAVQSAPPARATAAPHSGRLPRSERITGRDEAVSAVSERLAAHRFVTIRGPGGVGKTTVAVAVAHAMQAGFVDGVRFLDLGALSDAELDPEATAASLGVDVSGDDPPPWIVNSPGDPRALLILDNCEHVIDASARLAEVIRQRATDVSILATSRETLGVSGEHVIDLGPLDCPAEGTDIAPDDLLRYPATRLFLERAAAGGFRDQLSGTDARIVSSICRKLDGLPLALELAASRVAAHGLVETAELLNAGLCLAWRGRRTAPPRHQTLVAMLNWSYSSLAPDEQALLERLSVFPGAFTLQQALSTTESPDTVEGIVQALEQLFTKSLVASCRESGQARFRLLETTRLYAAHLRKLRPGASKDGLLQRRRPTGRATSYRPTHPLTLRSSTSGADCLGAGAAC